MSPADRLRIRLQERWIRAIVREELIQILSDMSAAAQSAHDETLTGTCEVAIEKIKERTEADRGRNGL